MLCFADPGVAAALAPPWSGSPPDRRCARRPAGAAGPLVWRAPAHPAALEAWLTFRDGSTAAIRALPSRRARFVDGLDDPESERNWANLMRQEARGRLRLSAAARHDPLLPTTPFAAPSRARSSRCSIRCAIASLSVCAWRIAGVPQVSLPLATVDGCHRPVNLGPRGSDATWSRWPALWRTTLGRNSVKERDTQHSGSRRGGPRAVRGLAGADRQERRCSTPPSGTARTQSAMR